MSEAQRELLQAELMAPAAGSEGRVRDVRFYSGSIIPRFDWWTGEEYELQFSMDPKDVNLDLLNGGAPVFKDHWASVDSTVGVTSNARLDGKNAYASLRFSDREDLEGMWQDIQTGILKSVSMGVSIETLEDITPKKKGSLKRLLARGWQPFEISVVPIGADPKAKFLAAQFMSDRHFQAGERHRSFDRDSLVAIVEELEARLKARIPQVTRPTETEVEADGEATAAPSVIAANPAAIARYQLALARQKYSAGAQTERRIG